MRVFIISLGILYWGIASLGQSIMASPASCTTDTQVASLSAEAYASHAQVTTPPPLREGEGLLRLAGLSPDIPSAGPATRGDICAD